MKNFVLGILCVLGTVFVGGIVNAQTVLLQIDLASIGITLEDAVVPADVDGNAVTAEWVILRSAASTAQVVAVSPAGAYCFGPAFPLQKVATTHTVESWFGRSVLLRRFKGEVTLIALTRPPC